MPTGTPWGAKWEYAWFRGKVRLPQEARGRRIVLRCDAVGNGFCAVNPGAESRVLINGREAGGKDWAHPDLPLALRGVPGRTYEVMIEAYAGHGPLVCSSGVALDGVPTVPEPPPKQQQVREITFGVWEEDAFQACIDVHTLLELRDALDPNSLRVAQIDDGLRRFTLAADLELPHAEALKTIRAARKILLPLLACRNGSTAPRLYCFGHSHIDVAWLWPLAETERKCARTFATQLALMAEYPEYKFLQSQAHLYWMTKRQYPELYARIKAAARKGQWLPEGGMWVEADTNISGGESLIRQILHGKRFFREEFGVECELLWLPDVFGYSGSLPQILVGCGMKYFSTQKIFWTYNGGEPFPLNSFWWEGIDGTRILSHIHNDYNSQTNPATLIERWNQRPQKDGFAARIVPFGWGDGGGGPTRIHLEYLRRQRDLEGVPRTTMASPLTFFRDEEAKSAGLPVYVGELYFQAHRGTYTTQARTKRGNRLCEIALREAELWGTVAAARGRFRYPAQKMDAAWKGVLLNQFHDIIPGSSIHRVYEEAEALHARVLGQARAIAAEAARSLVQKDGRAVTIFNSLPWARHAIVALPKSFRCAVRHAQRIATQRIGNVLHAEAEIPGCGWTSLHMAEGSYVADNPLKVSTDGLENEHLRLRVNGKGEITSLVDKATGREIASAPLNSLRMYKDVPREFDAWDVDSTYKLAPVDLPGPAKVSVIGRGPLVGVLRVERVLRHSKWGQEIWLRRGSRCVEFRTRVDWREKHKILKANFPTVIHANEAIHEVQFGHLRRPNHASRPFDADRFEVANQKWTALAEEHRGVAVLNDCKYGVNVENGSINLTLLRSPQAPDMLADQGSQVFTYAFLVWNGSFYESEVVHAAYELNTPPLAVPGAAPDQSVLVVDAPNVMVETVKPAEDGSGDIIVRLYETKRTATRCRITSCLPVKKVVATDMLENGKQAVTMRNGTVSLDFKPFEIKTLRLGRV